ncbi:type II and III secretion system protein [Candidatus Cloacimonadaceae bacterium]
MKYLLLFVILLGTFFICELSAQAVVIPASTVSISSDVQINDALNIIESFSEKLKRKKIINLSDYDGPIKIPINNLDWLEALELIALKNKLVLTESSGFFAIENIPAPVKEAAPPNPLVIQAREKQVRIKAVAMLADRSYLKSLGIDWSTVVNGEVSINAGFAGASQLSSLMTLSGGGSTDIGRYTVDINTLIKAMETNQKGNIIAQPNIIVSSGKQGYIQVGQDISVKTTDEAGNTTDTFFATGVIMDVAPIVVEVDGTDLVRLKLSIERSSGVPSAVSTIITKSKSSTEVVLYNNEETVIGGLFDTDETRVRGGIPILKDLPWWVLGIRYLTGYNTYEKKERELVITIKVEIVDNALDRMAKASETGSGDNGQKR